ncbi:MAG: cation transporter [Acidobacteria bacterium]|nr:cation transporter [Acidobacteriota bacterium]
MGHDHSHSHGHNHGHHHGHDHGPTTAGRLALSAAIFFVSFLVQGIGGFWSGSVGLISDSLENLNDVLVNLLGLASLAIANRREPCDDYAFGFHRLEVINSFIGVGFLLALAVGVGFKAVDHLRHPQAILTGWVLIFALCGLALNVLAAVALVPKDKAQMERDLSLKAAYMHAFSDSLTSVGLVLSMLVIRFTGWRWMDPAVAFVILIVILRGAWMLIKDATAILMHKAAFDHDEARAEMLKVQGVTGVDDLRSWKVCGHLTVATAHVTVSVDRLDDTEPILHALEHALEDHFGVRHLTLHFETAAMSGKHHHRFIHQHEARAHDHHQH